VKQLEIQSLEFDVSQMSETMVGKTVLAAVEDYVKE